MNGAFTTFWSHRNNAFLSIIPPERLKTILCELKNPWDSDSTSSISKWFEIYRAYEESVVGHVNSVISTVDDIYFLLRIVRVDSQGRVMRVLKKVLSYFARVWIVVLVLNVKNNLLRRAKILKLRNRVARSGAENKAAILDFLDLRSRDMLWQIMQDLYDGIFISLDFLDIQFPAKWDHCLSAINWLITLLRPRSEDPQEFDLETLSNEF